MSPPVAEASLTDRIGAFAAGLHWHDVPAAIGDRARDRVLDALATTVAGRIAAPHQPIGILMAAEPSGDATVLASGRTASAGMAAFANGVAAHALLYEDLNLTSADHPGVVIVPAALAAAESGLPGRNPDPVIEDLLLAVLAGYEVQCHLGAIAGSGVIARGFRTTSVFGTVAAAVAASKAWRLSAHETAVAASIGANFACGVTEGWSHGSHEPYQQAGVAAQNGILAARLAAAGAAGAPTTFEGQNGFLRAFADRTPDSSLPLGDAWRIMEVICKPYPCSGGKIGAIDSSRALREAGLEPAAIVRVRVWLPELYFGYPGASREAPYAAMSQAQASGQFCVAATLLGYTMEAVETFARDFANADIAALTRRVVLYSQPETTLCRVEVHLNDGTVRSAQADRSDRLIPSIDAMSAKLELLTDKVWKKGAAQAVVRLLGGPAGTPSSALSRHFRSDM